MLHMTDISRIEFSQVRRDFDALAMAIEEGRWNEGDPRADAIIAAARVRGLAPAALEVFQDSSVPTPVRERALATIAGRVLKDAEYALVS